MDFNNDPEDRKKHLCICNSEYPPQLWFFKFQNVAKGYFQQKNK